MQPAMLGCVDLLITIGLDGDVVEHLRTTVEARVVADDKARAAGATHIANDAVIEPFTEGRSERILIVGERAWHLRLRER
jgi:hypothetical protein